MKEILFVGSFLSKKTGTQSIGESLEIHLKALNIRILLSSKFENKFLRIIDILKSIIFFRGHKVHVDVFSDSAFRIAEIATWLAKLRKKQIILTLHGGKLHEFYDKEFLRVKRVFMRAEIILTPSIFLLEYFENIGFKVYYLPNAVDKNKFPYLRRVDHPFSLLWVRAFASIYNPHVPIEILKRLKVYYPDATLTMVGPDKGNKQEVIQLIDELNLGESVRLEGSVNNSELFNYYQKHRVFLNTTSYESFGMAVFEAASCGVPVVSNMVGEIPYIWDDDENILLVNNNSLVEYVVQIRRIFENRDLEMKISQGAKNITEKYSWEEIKVKWLEYLE